MACCSGVALYRSPIRAAKPNSFELLPTSKTGIDFANQLSESDTLNILNQANIYNGGGVGIGDFNRDGMMDVYFAANMVSNKLYLNTGKMKFKDITETAKVNGSGRWCTGVSVVDINQDGWPDIYVSASFRSDPKLRTNLLYINQGLDKKGFPFLKNLRKLTGCPILVLVLRPIFWTMIKMVILICIR